MIRKIFESNGLQKQEKAESNIKENPLYTKKANMKINEK